MKILCVCLGNICRSPMAEGILHDLASRAQLDWEIESAGTGDWHIGQRPDRRAIAVCAKHGVDITTQRARQISISDLDRYDLILTMDDENHRNVLSMTESIEQKNKIKRMMSYGESTEASVPDPYYDGKFEEVFELLSMVCRRFVALEMQKPR